MYSNVLIIWFPAGGTVLRGDGNHGRSGLDGRNGFYVCKFGGYIMPFSLFSDNRR